MASPEPVTDDGGFDLQEVISHYELEEVTVGEATIEPRRVRKSEKAAWLLKRLCIEVSENFDEIKIFEGRRTCWKLP